MHCEPVAPWPVDPIPPGAGTGRYAMIRRLEGMAAYQAGQPSRVCPYPVDTERQFDARCWIDGYVQARGPQWPPLDTLADPPDPNPWGDAWGDTPVG